MLVIEPSNRRAAQLRESWGHPPKGLQIWEEPVGSLEEEVRWYSYNDPRLDGMHPPEDFLSQFRNISVIAEEVRLQRHLGDVLQEWLATLQAPGNGGALILQSSDPESLISASTTLLTSLQCLVLWTDPKGQPEPAGIDEAVAFRLEEACFRRSSDDPFLWLRDETLALQHQLAIARAELGRLEDDQRTQARLLEERDRERVALAAEGRRLSEALNASREEGRALHERCHTLEAQHAELKSCVAALEQEFRELVLQREGLLAKAEAIAMEAELARKGSAELEQEYSHLLAEHQILLKAHDLAVQQRGALDDQVGQLRQENTVSREQRDALKNQNFHLTDRVQELLTAQETLQEDQDSMILERQAIENERAQLMEAHERLLAEHADLQRRLEEAARLTARTEQELALIRDLFVQVSTAQSPPTE